VFARAVVSGQANLHICGMQLNDAQVIFCETFDTPFPNTNRSGQLNGTLWGVSRVDGNGIGFWHASTLDGCNGPQPASPDATDVVICNGQLRESVNDGGSVVTLAMYPKQPFDFANRTGTVAFDITNDTSGSHGAWPEFWITDKPVPAPFMHGGPCDFCSLPRHGLGIRLDASGGDCPNGWRAGSAVVVRDYMPEDRGLFDPDTTGMQIRQMGCATLSSGANGAMNHVELRVSQNQVDIYASDAGSRTLKLINRITNANLTLTKGLIWISYCHYNADKSGVPHSIHTFTWDNVAFDGPATYRDLSFDVLDKLTPVQPNVLDLGWTATPSAPANLQTLPMTTQNISGATSA